MAASPPVFLTLRVSLELINTLDLLVYERRRGSQSRRATRSEIVREILHAATNEAVKVQD